jgi:hypothetical protein
MSATHLMIRSQGCGKYLISIVQEESATGLTIHELTRLKGLISDIFLLLAYGDLGLSIRPSLNRFFRHLNIEVSRNR